MVIKIERVIDGFQVDNLKNIYMSIHVYVFGRKWASYLDELTFNLIEVI